ncbi:MAG: AAA family ATPase, partial [Coriobacteriia bacterium]|nr:AAA family ATPase [Coriobacteriia bacterium]
MIHRSFGIERIDTAWERRSLVWLMGVRRSGKTTLAQGLPDIEYFDCDLASARRDLQDPESFLSSVRGKRVVLDEIHRLPDPAGLLKVAADHFPDVRVLATGSSTLQATSKFRDSLTGRKTEIWLTPMMSADLEAFGGDLARRLTRGGLPPFFLPQQLPVTDFQEWMDSYWARDVQELFRVERRPAFMKLLELVVINSGGPFEATRYAGPCEVSRPTITNWLNVLEITKVVHVVRPFSSRRSREVVATPRAYAFDTGFVTEYRGWTNTRPDDFGVLWEHYVLNEINARLSHVDVGYWRTTSHQEVDFIVSTHGRNPVAVECKWSSANAGDLTGMRAFLSAYSEATGLMVAPDIT